MADACLCMGYSTGFVATFGGVFTGYERGGDHASIAGGDLHLGDRHIIPHGAGVGEVGYDAQVAGLEIGQVIQCDVSEGHCVLQIVEHTIDPDVLSLVRHDVFDVQQRKQRGRWDAAELLPQPAVRPNLILLQEQAL